jgi:hypothetical protein
MRRGRWKLVGVEEGDTAVVGVENRMGKYELLTGRAQVAQAHKRPMDVSLISHK